jgi:hypothetical protein
MRSNCHLRGGFEVQDQYNGELHVYLPQTSSPKVRNIDGSIFGVPFLRPSH